MDDSNKYKILIADDEEAIRDVVKILLEEKGYEVIVASNGREAVDLADESVDLFLLDVNMPIMTGLAAGMEIRKKYLAPMIFLTAYTGESDKAVGFSVGADDYIGKPFSNAELLMRVEAHLRRANVYSSGISKNLEKKSGENRNIVELQDLIIDKDAQTIIKNGEVIKLTYTEYRILLLFAENRKKIFSLDNIYESVWNESAIGDNAIMVHIRNIRKKIGDNPREPRYIKTAWGKGYYAD